MTLDEASFIPSVHSSCLMDITGVLWNTAVILRCEIATCHNALTRHYPAILDSVVVGACKQIAAHVGILRQDINLGVFFCTVYLCRSESVFTESIAAGIQKSLITKKWLTNVIIPTTSKTP